MALDPRGMGALEARLLIGGYAVVRIRHQESPCLEAPDPILMPFPQDGIMTFASYALDSSVRRTRRSRPRGLFMITLAGR